MENPMKMDDFQGNPYFRESTVIGDDCRPSPLSSKIPMRVDVTVLRGPRLLKLMISHAGSHLRSVEIAPTISWGLAKQGQGT